MPKPCRSWWRNCALETDSEIFEIDKMEDHIAPISRDIVSIRELISSLELCHHKADRWIYNIIEAIGKGNSKKGLGTHSPGKRHSIEKVWQNAYASLSAWCAGCPSTKVNLFIEKVPSSQLLASLGERTPLKEWQVQRVMDKIRNSIHYPLSCDDPTAQYKWILLNGSDYECAYLSECPEYYKEHEEFWFTTVRTLIHDIVNGHEAELSLGLAIDMLWPCHCGFLENLQIVLEAIGGRLNPRKSFAACGRNISQIPKRERLEIIAKTLRSYGSAEPIFKDVEKQVLDLLGAPTEVKRWLAASLEKTIRLQLYPPSELQEISALKGPDWIKQ